MPIIVHLPGEKSFLWTDLTEMREARLRVSDLPGLISWLRWGTNNPDAAGLQWRLRLCQSLINALPPVQRPSISGLVLSGDIAGLVEAARIPAQESDHTETLKKIRACAKPAFAAPGFRPFGH